MKHLKKLNGFERTLLSLTALFLLIIIGLFIYSRLSSNGLSDTFCILTVANAWAYRL